MTKDVTAYQYYNKDAKRRTQVNVLDELFPELPNEKYDVIQDEETYTTQAQLDSMYLF